LLSDTWGFAIPKTQTGAANLVSSFVSDFDNTYANETNLPSSTAKYRNVPTSSTKFAETDTYSGSTDDYTLYFAASVSAAKPSGVYQTTITYTGTAIDLEPVIPCNELVEVICYTVDMQYANTPGTHEIGLWGGVANIWNHTYDWDIFVDGQPITDCSGGNRCTGVGGSNMDISIPSGQHQIKILPHNDPEPGWGNAFTMDSIPEIVTLDAPLTTMAFAPKPSESTTSAAYMFHCTFCSTHNLTTTATIIDTYKLPETITDLAGFLSRIHGGNGGNPILTSPINLSPLSGWLSNNNSITNLGDFLWETHGQNTNLASPIDLTPISGWFSNNTSITDLQYFLSQAHWGNTYLTSSIDLTPLSGWFSDNRDFNSASYFLASTHLDNPNLTLTGQTVLPNWIKTATQNGTPVWNGTYTFYQTFYLPSAQGGDTGEPKFQDGTVLSSIGEPNSARQTYTNRTGISPLNNANGRWK